MNDRSLIRWVLLAVVVIALLNLPPSLSQSVKSAFREAARPLEVLVGTAIRNPWEYLTSLGKVPELIREKKDLQLEVARLNAEQSRLRLLEAENTDLRALLNLDQRRTEALIAAEVTARSRDGWWQTVRLNKGYSDGVAEDMAVISMDGLVGRTVAVSRNTADVLLLSDPTCRVSARLLRSGSFGVVSGRGPSWQGQVYCRMDFIHKSEAIRSGDQVVSSGLGGVFPPNIPIGYVDRVSTDSSGLYQQADVITKADLSSLRYVFVMAGKPAGEGDTP